jgi:hypothetical protein
VDPELFLRPITKAVDEYYLLSPEVVPVRLILVPGTGHGPAKLSPRKRKMNEELAWIDRFLLSEEQEVNEVFDKSCEIPDGTELEKHGLIQKECGSFPQSTIIKSPTIGICGRQCYQVDNH